MTDAQRKLMKRFAGAGHIVDVHCHCLPGLDDGPADLVRSIELCRALADQGVTDVIATPHQLGRYEGKNSAKEVRQCVADLNTALEWSKIPLKVHPGADVRVHERLLDLLQSDTVLTAADGHRYLMLELPHDPFIDISPLIDELTSRGITPVITHPERHDALVHRPQFLVNWINKGAVAQVTGASLLGDFGVRAHAAAWDWLGRGLATLVASDSHDLVRRPPRVLETIDLIAKRLSHVIAQRTCIENPARLLAGQDLLRRGLAIPAEASQ